MRWQGVTCCKWVEEMGSWSAIPISPMVGRLRAVQERFGVQPLFLEGDIREYAFVRWCLEQCRPDAIMHLGECPSAPYSMIEVDHATWVQTARPARSGCASP